MSGLSSPSVMILSAPGYSRGRSRTASTTEKMAVLAPIPRESVTITATDRGHARRRLRLP